MKSGAAGSGAGPSGIAIRARSGEGNLRLYDVRIATPAPSIRGFTSTKLRRCGGLKSARMPSVWMFLGCTTGAGRQRGIRNSPDSTIPSLGFILRVCLPCVSGRLSPLILPQQTSLSTYGDTAETFPISPPPRTTAGSPGLAARNSGSWAEGSTGFYIDKFTR